MPEQKTRTIYRHAAILLAVSLSACASAPPLTEAGAHVRKITTEQARSCKFLRIVQYNDNLFLNVGKNPTVMRAIGDTNMLNLVAAAGANAYVLTKDDSNWFIGTVAYQGDAYICP